MKTLIRPPILAQRPKKDVCEHDWKKQVLIVKPQERTNEQLRNGMEYRGGKAAFQLRKCLKCDKIEYLDYRVEKI